MNEGEHKEKEREFHKFIVSEYLRYGSVDELFKENNYDIPISYPGVHHLLDRWGIVKAAGPNTSLAESIGFLVRMVEERIPLERLYKKMPPSFSPSMATLHRMYRDVKEQVKKEIEERTPRRTGTALVIVPEFDEEVVLVGKDISPPRPSMGKMFGSASLPMGYSKKNEEGETSILRVLQQEVFTKSAINQNMPDVIGKNPEPFMYVDIADVRVGVFRLVLPRRYSDQSLFFSHKLKKHRFTAVNGFSLTDLKAHKYRTGVVEIVLGYRSYLNSFRENKSIRPIYASSYLNLGLRSLHLARQHYLQEQA